jgi:hypothetical protein
LEVDIQFAKEPNEKEHLEKRIGMWKARAARYESEPETQEGRKELMGALAMAKYHHYEFGSAAFQIAIVLASSYLITGVLFLFWAAGGVGIAGLLFSALAILGPSVLHLF